VSNKKARCDVVAKEGCCILFFYAIFGTGPAVSMGSELLVAHVKLGQFPLLPAYVVSM
jgi:hypothetical protein